MREERDEMERALLGDTQPLRRSGSSIRKHKSSILYTVCPYILGNELCERLAYYGLATNLVTYVTSMIGGSAGNAAILVSIFEGACYTTPIIGAVFADSLWGRYKTILVFSLIYLVGIAWLTLSSWPPVGAVPPPDKDPTAYSYLMLCGALSIIALGTGGIKPNVSAFGADQFNENDPRDVREKESFFNYFYLAVNVGSLIACTVIVYIQDQYSWTVGFAIPGVAMLLAIIFFLSGKKSYVHVQPTESPMVRVYKVCAAAIANRWRKEHAPAEVTFAPQDNLDSLHGAELYSQIHHANNRAPGRAPNNNAIVSDDGKLQVPMLATKSYRWLEDAITEWETSQGQHMHVEGLRGHYTPKQVEEVKLVLRLLPVFGATVLYWTIYTQMSVMFVSQGSLMRREFDWHGSTIHIPAASMAVFNTIAIIVLIWIYDALFEPFLRRIGYKMTLLKRIGWGMVVAAVAMATAAVIEWQRLQACHGCSANSPQNFSIFWQAPQYMLVGLSEVFTSIGQMEFFYDQAPDVMRSCSMALGLLSSALGSYSAGALTWLVQEFSDVVTGQQWLPNDLNLGRLDLFFLFMMALMLFNVIIFLFVALNYEYKVVQHKESARTITQETLPEEEAPLTRVALVISPVISIKSRPSVSSYRPMLWTGEEGEEEEEEVPNPDIYARSLAYQPPQPVRPQTFR